MKMKMINLNFSGQLILISMCAQLLIQISVAFFSMLLRMTCSAGRERMWLNHADWVQFINFSVFKSDSSQPPVSTFVKTSNYSPVTLIYTERCRRSYRWHAKCLSKMNMKEYGVLLVQRLSHVDSQSQCSLSNSDDKRQRQLKTIHTETRNISCQHCCNNHDCIMCIMYSSNAVTLHN